MILDGAVSDVMIFTQHIHDNIALVLSNQASTNNVTRLPRAIPLLLPLFILTVWDVVRVGVEELRLLLLLLTDSLYTVYSELKVVTYLLFITL
ncbi:unnamed protein product [Rhizophagus irregularis]|nr:unnamed protein product [Rhizophagus irregularis]